MAVAPRWLLIGEAPGYQGARVSGLAFTSERLLCEGKIPRVCPAPRISTRATPWSEPSASIVWQTLVGLGIEQETVLWNVFPWHPHPPDQPMANRTPMRAEVHAGTLILEGLIDLFPAAEVLAIGQIAQHALAESRLPCHGTLRHPAYGGKADFVQGLRAKVAEYQSRHELDALFE
ncbi:MAG: uracil-DNA glycosylase [Acidobacteriaceae bacterium]